MATYCERLRSLRQRLENKTLPWRPQTPELNEESPSLRIREEVPRGQPRG